MLGIVHRRVLGLGPPQFKKLLKFQAATEGADRRSARLHKGRHRLQLAELDTAAPDYLRHSLLGVTTIYNLLPAHIVEGSTTVSAFQTALQELLMQRAQAGCEDWASTFSSRISLVGHPLVCMLLSG